jgi:hypothetical protein
MRTKSPKRARRVVLIASSGGLLFASLNAVQAHAADTKPKQSITVKCDIGRPTSTASGLHISRTIVLPLLPPDPVLPPDPIVGPPVCNRISDVLGPANHSETALTFADLG